MNATGRFARTSPRWIASALLAAPVLVLSVVAWWPVAPRSRDLPAASPDGPLPGAADPTLSPPSRIYARIGMFEGGVTDFYTPRIRLTRDESDARTLPGWQVCTTSDTASVVVLEPTVRTASSRTLCALPLPPAKDYRGPGWTEFRCETDDVPAGARADAAWRGRWTWTWPSLRDELFVPADAPPAPPKTDELVLRADGTATLGSAPGVQRPWGVVDGVLYLKRFDAPAGRYLVVIGVRDGDDVIRFAAEGEARRAR